MIKLLKHTILAAFHQLLTLVDYRNLKIFFISARGSNLNKLRYHEIHSLKKIFDSYDRGQIAKRLDISIKLLGDVLQDYKLPCQELAKRMKNLADGILKAEAVEI